VTRTIDVSHGDEYSDIIDTSFDKLGRVDIVLIAYGTLPDQNACENSVNTTRDELTTNAISTISLLTLIATRLEGQGHGQIAVLTSVAGDRGRKSNYVYGSAKAMVSVFLQGLRNRLFSHGVKVLDIKPGFVDTPMTADFKKGFLWSQPDKIAAIIVNAIDKGKSEIYAPFYWRYIMFIIRNIPESIFKRLSL
jgi:short-subunit dehydrogenase